MSKFGEFPVYSFKQKVFWKKPDHSCQPHWLTFSTNYENSGGYPPSGQVCMWACPPQLAGGPCQASVIGGLEMPTRGTTPPSPPPPPTPPPNIQKAAHPATCPTSTQCFAKPCSASSWSESFQWNFAFIWNTIMAVVISLIVRTFIITDITCVTLIWWCWRW